MQSNAKTVSEYLASLPADRKKHINSVRRVIKKHLPKGYKEGMLYGMIGYYIPLSKYPVTYNKEPLAIAALASQKNYMSLYLMGIYSDIKFKKWFEDEWKKSGKKMNMGKSCIRFKDAEDLPMDVVAGTISYLSPEDFITLYEKARGIRS